MLCGERKESAGFAAAADVSLMEVLGQTAQGVHCADGNAEALAAPHGFQIGLGVYAQPGENGGQVRRDVAAFVFSDGAPAPVDELQVVREGEGEDLGTPICSVTRLSHGNRSLWLVNPAIR